MSKISLDGTESEEKMDNKIEVLRSLERAMDINKDLRLGLFIKYIASMDDLAYIEDDELKRLIDEYAAIYTRFYFHEIKPCSCNVEMYKRPFHELTREHEQTAYERFKALERSEKLYFPLEERVPWYDFMCRFQDQYCTLEGLFASDFEGYYVINHVSRFYNHMPQKYVPMYVIGKAGDGYVCSVTNSYKLPDALELFEFITEGWCLYRSNVDALNAGEWYALVFDQEGLVRPWTYSSRVNFGMAVRPDKHEYEIYDQHQAVEIFHELFAKCNEIINW